MRQEAGKGKGRKTRKTRGGRMVRLVSDIGLWRFQRVGFEVVDPQTANQPNSQEQEQK